MRTPLSLTEERSLRRTLSRTTPALRAVLTLSSRGGTLSTRRLSSQLQACWPLTKTSARRREVRFDGSRRVCRARRITLPLLRGLEATTFPVRVTILAVIPAATLVFSDRTTRPCTQRFGTGFAKRHDA